jgi:hypothetical protein
LTGWLGRPTGELGIGAFCGASVGMVPGFLLVSVFSLPAPSVRAAACQLMPEPLFALLNPDVSP